MAMTKAELDKLKSLLDKYKIKYNVVCRESLWVNNRDNYFVFKPLEVSAN